MEEGGEESELALTGVPQAEDGPARSLRRRASPARLVGTAAAVLLVVAAVYQITRSFSQRSAASADTNRLEALWGGTWLRGESEFQLTVNIYDNRNHTSACAGEFGDNFTTADWTFDLKSLSVEQVTGLCDTLGINETFNAAHFFVSNKGGFYFGIRRAYFFERHNGDPPGNWLVHDMHGAITLGSWYDISGPVLCVKREEGDVTWQRHPGMYLNLYAAGVRKVMPLAEAKVACIHLGAACAGVTCGHDASFGTGAPGMIDHERSCTVREGLTPFGIQPSPTGEVTYVKHTAAVVLLP